jgi:hypothetical protein
VAEWWFFYPTVATHLISFDKLKNSNTKKLTISLICATWSKHAIFVAPRLRFLPVTTIDIYGDSSAVRFFCWQPWICINGDNSASRFLPVTTIDIYGDILPRVFTGDNHRYLWWQLSLAVFNWWQPYVSMVTTRHAFLTSDNHMQISMVTTQHHVFYRWQP